MSREDNEQSEQAFYDGLLPRGPGDGDAYGYPGQPKGGDDNDGGNNPTETDQTDVPF